MSDRGSIQPTGRNKHGRRGFTLVELLIVIGIIGVLVGLLLPAVSRVRIAGQKVATQSTISRIAFACEAYFSDQGAYPGPFADDQLVSADMLTPTTTIPHLSDLASPQLMYPDPASATPANIAFPHAPTTSENLFLGLCGGLRVSTVGGVTTFVYDPALAKRAAGPAGLNPAVAKHSQSYLELGDADISSMLVTRNPLNTDRPDVLDAWWWPNSANGGVAYTAPFKGDSPVFEFMDRFSKPRPILYLRAVRGVTKIDKIGLAAADNKTGFIYDPTDTAVPAATSPYQYRPDQIEYAYSNIGKNRDGTSQAGKAWKVDLIDLPDVLIDPAAPATTTNIKFHAGDQRYFVNEQVSTGDPANVTPPGPNSLVPQQKDKFILISAGPDGLYGTADDIRN